MYHAAAAALCVALISLAVRYPDRAPPPLLWLGGMSYSLFLIHVPIGGRVVNLANRWKLSPELEGLVCLMAMVLSLFVAWGFLGLIERPSQRLSRQLFKAS